MLYYYPHLFNSTKYLSRHTAKDESSLLEECTLFDFKFPANPDDFSIFNIDNIRGNLPQLIAEALLKMENNVNMTSIPTHADILKKVGNIDGLFSDGSMEPFLGYLTKEEVKDMIGFLTGVSFQNKTIEELKSKMLGILKIAKDQGTGIIYRYI